MLLIVYTTTWEIQSSNAIWLCLSSCFASSASKLVLKFLFSAQLVQTLSQVEVLFSVFWFSEFSFSSWIYWFQNLEIFPPFLRNSCDKKIIWWFGVTIVTVIFTCRYFKLSWNTSALSQSNGTNFSGSSINRGIYRLGYDFFTWVLRGQPFNVWQAGSGWFWKKRSFKRLSFCNHGKKSYTVLRKKKKCCKAISLLKFIIWLVFVALFLTNCDWIVGHYSPVMPTADCGLAKTKQKVIVAGAI